MVIDRWSDVGYRTARPRCYSGQASRSAMRAIALATTQSLVGICLLASGCHHEVARSYTKPVAHPPRAAARAVLVVGSGTAKSIADALDHGGLIRVRQTPELLEVVCPSLGKNVYGRMELDAPEWLNLQDLSPTELDENLEFPEAVPPKPLRVTHRITARVPVPLTQKWVDSCLEATHFVRRLDADVVDGQLHVRRVVLSPILREVAPTPSTCRVGFHLATSIPGLCVQRVPFSCQSSEQEQCVKQCEQGDAESCERLVRASTVAPGLVTQKQMSAAERACALHKANCCELATILLYTPSTAAWARSEALARGGCGAGSLWCCATLGIILDNAKDLAGSAKATAAACSLSVAFCLRAARRSRSAGLLDLAQEQASVACQADEPNACREMRDIAKEQQKASP